ncbi:MAG: TlpA family protein disulfide reductase [Chlorobi bacterium]|nr:TlpA family protein disulfide reductase [Chlorobiota bacterium]
MKNIILAFFIITLYVSNTFTQTIAPDFTLENTKGVSYNLYDELNAGKSVLLSFFSVSCGTCADEVPLIQAIYEQNDSSKFTLMAIDSYLADNEAIEEFISTYNGNYVGFSTYSNNDVLSDSMYNIEYFPQNFVVCPNKWYKKSSLDNVQLILDNCPSAASNIDKISSQKNRIMYISTNDGIYLKFYTEKEASANIEVIDLLGNIRLKRSFNAMKGENDFSIAHNNLTPGYYLIKMMIDRELADVKKAIIF